MNTWNLGLEARPGFWGYRQAGGSFRKDNSQHINLDRSRSDIKIVTLIYILLFTDVQNTFRVISIIISLGSQCDSSSCGGKLVELWMASKESQASPKLLCAMGEKSHKAERGDMWIQGLQHALGPKCWSFVLGQYSLQSSTEAAAKPPILLNLGNPPLLLTSLLSANDLASFSQRKCRETSLSPVQKPTYTLTCNSSHPTLLLVERGQSPIQTNPSHLC